MWKSTYSVHEGTMKNSSQKIKIYRRFFPNDSESKQRFQVLMAAFNQGIVLADNIFLSYEEEGFKKFNNFHDLILIAYFIYIIEPWFSGYDNKFVPLFEFLKLDMTFAKKHRLFQNLIIIVKSLHELGIANYFRNIYILVSYENCSMYQSIIFLKKSNEDK